MIKTARSNAKVTVCRSAMEKMGLVKPPNRQCVRRTAKSDHAPATRIRIRATGHPDQPEGSRLSAKPKARTAEQLT